MHIFSSLPVLALATLSAAGPLPGFVHNKWDVIVVGAGPAGIIVADRMAEAGKKTLLLEDGGPSYYITGGRERPGWLDGSKLSRVDVPGLYKSIFSGSSSLTCNTQQVQNPVFGGCTIGGSSAINAGLFFQPPSSDFDKYFPDGWKSKDVASSIKKLYNRQPASAMTSQNDQHYLKSGYKAAKDWLVGHAGYREVNYKDSPNDKSKVFGRPVFDYKQGQRGGPVHAYLQRAQEKSTFHFEHGVRVHRVHRQGKHATGVEVTVHGHDTTIKLADNGRVILSGGAIQSPALLMKSAIGDPEVLESMQQAGVLKGHTRDTWINNTAVGKGLFDNPNTFIELSSNEVSSYTYSYDSPNPADANLYLKKRSGPYSFASETSAFWDTVKRNDGSIATMQGTIDSSGFGDFQASTNAITLNIYGTSGMGSRGKVVFDNNWVPGPSGDVYFSDPEDAQVIAQFIRRIFDALPQSSLSVMNYGLSQGSTTDQIAQYITSWSNVPYTRGTVNHWSSSCRLGHCVDKDALVKGMGNLHVVDGSIIPALSVNPQMGIMIAAEHAAERILKL